ncbi:Uncharacterised protein g10114 [Pycnogonum litorale]
MAPRNQNIAAASELNYLRANDSNLARMLKSSREIGTPRSFIERGQPFSEFESNTYLIKTNNLTDFSTRSVWSSQFIRDSVTSLDPLSLLHRTISNENSRTAERRECRDNNTNYVKNLWRPYECLTYRSNSAFKIVGQPKELNVIHKKLFGPELKLTLSDDAKKSSSDVPKDGRKNYNRTGEKAYTCKILKCKKSFARNEELTRHKRTHSGERPYMCSTCSKSFGRKDHLKKHQNTHLKSNEKSTYICSEFGCSNRYTRSDALTRHVASAHKKTLQCKSFD